jgi:hypothetical protein
MEPEGTLPCSQEPSTGPYPGPDESNPHFPTLFPYIHSNIIFPNTPKSSIWFPYFRFSDKSFARISHLSRACYMPHQSLRTSHVPPLVCVTKLHTHTKQAARTNIGNDLLRYPNKYLNEAKLSLYTRAHAYKGIRVGSCSDGYFNSVVLVTGSKEGWK